MADQHPDDNRDRHADDTAGAPPHDAAPAVVLPPDDGSPPPDLAAIIDRDLRDGGLALPDTPNAKAWAEAKRRTEERHARLLESAQREAEEVAGRPSPLAEAAVAEAERVGTPVPPDGLLTREEMIVRMFAGPDPERRAALAARVAERRERYGLRPGREALYRVADVKACGAAFPPVRPHRFAVIDAGGVVRETYETRRMAEAFVAGRRDAGGADLRIEEAA